MRLQSIFSVFLEDNVVLVILIYYSFITHYSLQISIYKSTLSLTLGSDAL